VDLNPSEIGARAEREVVYALERCGWHVFIPHLAPHTRIDVIAVRGSEVLRIQCKTSRLSRGALAFRTCSNTANVPRDYRGEIDAFGVYSPSLDRVFLVPISVTATTLCTLRLEPTASGQVKGIRLAADYELRPPG
jgi:hypothetical protein